MIAFYGADWCGDCRRSKALLDRLAGLPVVNPVPVLRWNSDKAYLAELGAKGVAVVPTVEVAARV